MNLSYKKGLAVMLVLATTMTTLLMPTLSADETVIQLSRDEVGQMAVEQSKAVKDLEVQLKDLVIQHSSINTQMNGLKAIYDLLPTYQTLHNRYQAITGIANYVTYLTVAVDPTKDQDQMTDGVDGGADTYAESQAIDLNAENALDAEVNNPANMSVIEYQSFISLQPQFAAMGITDPNISRSKEYETFVYPLRISGLSLQTGISQLNDGVALAKSGVGSGAEKLYDAVLLMEGYQLLQEQNHESALAAFESAKSKFEKGHISEVEFIIARNNEEIARRNRDKMRRDVENLKMSLNNMLGLDVMAEIELEVVVQETKALEPMNTYIEKALSERNEIISAKQAVTNKSTEFDLIDDYYSSSTDKYKIAALELEQLKTDLAMTTKSVEMNVQKAYMNVLEKEETLQIKRMAFENAKDQISKLELNVSLGFITEDTLNSASMLQVQAENDYKTAYTDYLEAYSGLVGASSLGPAFSPGGMQGGMGFE